MTTDKKITPSDALTDKQVSEFLSLRPDFFVNHPDLLESLNLPHTRGAAISLVERQIALLRQRNQNLNQRLETLLQAARENDVLFEKTKRLLLCLLEGEDFGDLVDALFYSFDHDFKIHCTTLMIYSGNQQSNGHAIPASAAKIVNQSEAESQLQCLKSNPGRPYLGKLSETESLFLFPNVKELGSAAVVPLVHCQNYGLLALGSRDPDYYNSTVDTIYLIHIADILNRLFPPLLQKTPGI